MDENNIDLSNDRENGVILLNRGPFINLKNSLMLQLNVRRNALFDLATRIHRHLNMTKSEDLSSDFYEFFDFRFSSGFQIVNALEHFEICNEEVERIFDAVFEKVTNKKSRSVFVLRNVLHDTFSPSLRQGGLEFMADTGKVTLLDSHSTLRWEVPHGHGATFGARRSYMGQALFQELSDIDWGEGAGGIIKRYNNVYHSADPSDHSVKRTVVNTFGPISERLLAA